jgi:hypothetical protein
VIGNYNKKKKPESRAIHSIIGDGRNKRLRLVNDRRDSPFKPGARGSGQSRMTKQARLRTNRFRLKNNIDQPDYCTVAQLVRAFDRVHRISTYFLLNANKIIAHLVYFQSVHFEETKGSQTWLIG